jgi:hypothetical protein
MEFISSTLETKTAREQADVLGRSVESVKSFRKRNRLHVSKERKDAMCRDRAMEMNLPGDKNQNWKGGVSKCPMRYKKTQMERYPERCEARKAVEIAIRTGKMNRLPCRVCGSEPAQAHHEDYSKPLDVTFLCKKHHDEIHQVGREK